MRQNRIYITGILLLFAFLSGRAQQPRIDELECRNLKIGYEKTLHMIFPTPVKYLNMGDENIIGEVIQVCPSVIRLKSTVRDFKGETNLSVVTEDSRYYTYCISFDEGAQAVYKEGGTMPETAVLPEYHDYSPSRHALGSTATPSEPRLGFNTMAFGTSTTGYPCSSTPRYVTPLAATCPA